jgi:hypothetical protein
VSELQEHPDYADGYYAGFSLWSFDTDRAGSEEYARGYDAGEKAANFALAQLAPGL